jgi:hypothetical protein
VILAGTELGGLARAQVGPARRQGWQLVSSANLGGCEDAAGNPAAKGLWVLPVEAAEANGATVESNNRAGAIPTSESGVMFRV